MKPELQKQIKTLIEESEKEQNINSPYLEQVDFKVVRKYNPEYGDEKICKCGHPYHRHFDSYEEMSDVGCKYCGCFYFEESKMEPEFLVWYAQNRFALEDLDNQEVAYQAWLEGKRISCRSLRV